VQSQELVRELVLETMVVMERVAAKAMVMETVMVRAMAMETAMETAMVMGTVKMVRETKQEATQPLLHCFQSPELDRELDLVHQQRQNKTSARPRTI